MPDLPLGTAIAFDFETWDIHEEIALLHHIGVRRVQIYRNYARGITAKQILRILQPEGLIVDSLHGYFQMENLEGPLCDLSALDSAERKRALDIMRSEAEFARALGCTDIITHVVGADGTAHQPFRPDALAHSAEAMADIGQKTGARFLLENMPPGWFGCDAAMLRRIADEVESPHVGLVFDSGHAALGGDPVPVIHTMGPRLWGVHLQDNHGQKDEHLLPGSGTIDFERIARALAEVGFAGTFMLEVYCSTERVRQDLTPQRLAYLERLRRIASGLASGRAI